MTPIVPARPARPEEIPSAAAKRIKKAEKLGWTMFRCTYAKGTFLGERAIESIALGFRKGDHTVLITYEDGKFRSSWHLDRLAKVRHWVPSSKRINDILKGGSV